MSAVSGCSLRPFTSRFAPRVEALEDRSCPSVSALVSGHTLVIQGDDSANAVTVNDAGDGHVEAEITGAADAVSVSTAGIDTIQVNTGDGDDAVCYTLRGDLAQDLNLVVRTGSGQSRVDTSLLPNVASGRVNIEVYGGSGTSLVTGRFGNVIDTNLTVRAELGAGGGAFNFYLHGDVLGHARAGFLAVGGAGENTVSLHAEGVHVAAGAYLESDLRAGSGDGVTAFAYQGALDGRLKARSYGGAGKDRLATRVTLDPGSSGAADVGERGGGHEDRMTFGVYDHSRMPVDAWAAPVGLSALRAVAEGIEGEGLCYHTANVKALRCAVDELFQAA